MSDDTKVKQEAPNPHNAPDEIWLGLRGKSWEWDGCWNIRPFPINENIVIERYVRADLLATVRREQQQASREDYDYTVRLATIMRRHFYPDNEEWQPLETLNGVLSQIDNMIAGLMKRDTKPVRSFGIQEPTGPF